MGAIISIAWMCLLWVIKFSISLIVVVIIGIVPGFVFSSCRLTLFVYIGSILFSLNNLLSNPNHFVKIVSLSIILSCIISIFRWFSIIIVKALRKSDLYKNDKLISLSVCFIINILIYNVPFLNIEKFSSQLYVLLVLFALANFMSLSNGSRLYKKICNIAVKKGYITQRELRDIVISEHTDNDKKEDDEKKLKGLIQLLDNIYRYENRFYIITVDNRTFYFTLNKLSLIQKLIREEINRFGYMAFDEISDVGKIPFDDYTKLKIFIDDFMPDILYGHMNNVEIITITEKNSWGGLCDCCRAFSSDLIITANGQFCSELCNDFISGFRMSIDHEFKDFDNTLNISVFGALSKEVERTLYKQRYYVNKNPQRHGLAAEVANTTNDKLNFKNTELVGSKNLKNGPDRIVNGQEIQTKYCRTAKESINACFDKNSGLYKYKASKKGLQKVEVPREQYLQAIEEMKYKISQGKVPGYTDPDDAWELVLKGFATYQQAENIACAGNIDSIVHDFKEGVIIARTALPISIAIAFATQIWNGDDIETATQKAVYSSLSTTAKSALAYTFSSQIVKTEFIQQIFYKNTKELISILNTGVGFIICEYKSFVEYCQGYISAKQLFINLTTAGAAFTAATVVGEAVGGIFGLAGSIIGGATAGYIAGKVTNDILKGLTSDDAEEMQEIFNIQFELLAREYLLTQPELERINNAIELYDADELLKGMYKSTDRFQYVSFVILPVIAACYEDRTIISFN